MSSIPYSRLVERGDRYRVAPEELNKSNHGDRRRHSKHRKRRDCRDNEAEEEDTTFCKHPEKQAQRPNSNRNRRDSSTPTQKPANKLWREHSAEYDHRKGDKCQGVAKKHDLSPQGPNKEAHARDVVFPVDRIIRSLLDSVSHRDAGCLSFSVDYHKRKTKESRTRAASACRDGPHAPGTGGQCPHHGQETREQSTHVSERHRLNRNESTVDQHNREPDRRVHFQRSNDAHASERRSQHRENAELHHNRHLGVSEQGRRHHRGYRNRRPQSDESDTRCQTAYFKSLDSPTIDELNLTPQLWESNPAQTHKSKKQQRPDAELKCQLRHPGDTASRKKHTVDLDNQPLLTRNLHTQHPKPANIIGHTQQTVVQNNHKLKPFDPESQQPKINGRDNQEPKATDLGNHQPHYNDRDDHGPHRTDLDKQQPQATCLDNEGQHTGDHDHLQPAVQETCNSQTHEAIRTQSQVSDENLCADVTVAQNVVECPCDPPESGLDSTPNETASVQPQGVSDQASGVGQVNAPALSAEIRPAEALSAQEQHPVLQNHPHGEPKSDLPVTQSQQEEEMVCSVDTQPDENTPQTTNGNCYNAAQPTVKNYKSPESPILKSPSRRLPPPRYETDETNNVPPKDQNGAKSRKTRKRITFCDTPVTFYPDDQPLFAPTDLKFSEEIAGVESKQRTSGGVDLDADQTKIESFQGALTNNEFNKSISPRRNKPELDSNPISNYGERTAMTRKDVKYLPGNTHDSIERHAFSGPQCVSMEAHTGLNKNICVGDGPYRAETGHSGGARAETGHSGGARTEHTIHTSVLNGQLKTAHQEMEDNSVDINDDFRVLDKICVDPNRKTATCRVKFSDTSPTVDTTRRKLSANPFYPAYKEQINGDAYLDHDISHFSSGKSKHGHKTNISNFQSSSPNLGIAPNRNFSETLDSMINCERYSTSPEYRRTNNMLAKNKCRDVRRSVYRPGESIREEDHFYMGDRSLSKQGNAPFEHVGAGKKVNSENTNFKLNGQLFDHCDELICVESRNPEQIYRRPEDNLEHDDLCEIIYNTYLKNTFLNDPVVEMRPMNKESSSMRGCNREAETMSRLARGSVSYKVRCHSDAGCTDGASRRPGLNPAPVKDPVCSRIYHQINRLVNTTVMVDGEISEPRDVDEAQRFRDAKHATDYHEPHRDYLTEPLRNSVTYSACIPEPVHNIVKDLDHETVHLPIEGSQAVGLKDTAVSYDVKNHTLETDYPMSFQTKCLTANIRTASPDSVRKRYVFVSELTREPANTFGQRLNGEPPRAHLQHGGETRAASPLENTDEAGRLSDSESREFEQSPEHNYVIGRAHGSDILTMSTLQCRTNLKMLSLFSNDFTSVLSHRDIEFFDTYIRPLALDYVSVLDKEKVTMALTEKATSPPLILPSAYEIRSAEDLGKTDAAPETDVFSEIELVRATLSSPKREPTAKKRTKKKKRSISLKLRNFLCEEDIRERPFWVRSGRRVVRPSSPGNPFAVYEDEVYISTLYASEHVSSVVEGADRNDSTAGVSSGSPGIGCFTHGSDAAFGAVPSFAPETLIQDGAIDAKNSSFVKDRLDGLSRRLSQTELKIAECQKSVEDKMDSFLSQLLQPPGQQADCSRTLLEDKLELMSRKLHDAESKISESSRCVEDKLESLSRRLFESQYVGSTCSDGRPGDSENVDVPQGDGCLGGSEDGPTGSQSVQVAAAADSSTRVVCSQLPRVMTLLCASTSGVAFGWLLSLAQQCAENTSVNPLVDANSALAEVGSPFADSSANVAMESLYVDEKLYWPDNHDIYFCHKYREYLYYNSGGCQCPLNKRLSIRCLDRYLIF
ncbi:hypothetical protein Btru_063128 [Bulinus truncatus]|nr:hypothetical protein Btru_063128 [Bulinus truncatus]